MSESADSYQPGEENADEVAAPPPQSEVVEHKTDLSEAPVKSEEDNAALEQPSDTSSTKRGREDGSSEYGLQDEHDVKKNRQIEESEGVSNDISKMSNFDYAYQASNEVGIISNAPAVFNILSSDANGEVIEISPDKVGQIIGSKGAIIQDMQTRTGAKIFVNQNFPEGVNRQVNISGTPQQVKDASELIRRIIQEGPTAIHVNSLAGGPAISMTIDCAQSLVGRVIGAGGATIKELQSRSGAKIQIDQNFPEGVPRKINVSGTHAAVTLAAQLVSYVMENGPTLPPTTGSMPMPMGGGGGGGIYGPSITSSFNAGAVTTGTGGQTVIECPKAIVGKIIGRKGETIGDMQNKSGAKMQIDQNVPVGQPCKILITGNPHNIALATQLVQDLIMQGPGSGGGMGRGPMGWGMGGGYPMQPQGFAGFPSAFPQSQSMMQNPYGYSMQQQQQQLQFQMQQQQQQQQQQYQAQAYGGLGAAGYQQGVPQQQPQQQAYGAQNNASAYAQAASAAPKALPPGWSEHKTDDGNTYWYNSQTGVSQEVLATFTGPLKPPNGAG